jgi:hypothetical protein
MARVTKIRSMVKERNSVHQETACSATTFSGPGGRKYLQLDTFGSADRKLKGKVSQSIQFEREAAKQLRALIAEAFPDL